jgi:hypothetical protein
MVSRERLSPSQGRSLVELFLTGILIGILVSALFTKL